MKLVTIRNIFLVGGLAFLVLMGASSEAQAKGKGRGQRDSKWEKKCAKFVNCHDASEGRVDGRGPRTEDNDNWNSRRFRHRRDADRFNEHQRRRRHRRDWRSDRNDDWRDRDRDGRRRTWSRRGR